MPPEPQQRTSTGASSSSAFELDASAEAQQAALDLKVARRMYYGGFAGLPWLWFIAWLHFRRPSQLPSADPQLAKYARRSGIGALVGALLFVAWIVTVQLSWQSWGAFGRSIMLFIPEDSDAEL